MPTLGNVPLLLACASHALAAGSCIGQTETGTFYLYEPAEPTEDVTLPLAEINSDPTGIFFG